MRSRSAWNSSTVIPQPDGLLISHHEDQLGKVERGYGDKPGDCLEGFAAYLKDNTNAPPLGRGHQPASATGRGGRLACGRALLDAVLPKVRTRQWMLSPPIELRVPLAYHDDLTLAVHTVMGCVIEGTTASTAATSGCTTGARRLAHVGPPSLPPASRIAACGSLCVGPHAASHAPALAQSEQWMN